MRAHRTTLVALGMLGFALACTGDKDVPPPDSEVEVLVEGYRAIDGSNRANGRDVTFPDGTRLFAGTSGTGAPRDGRDQSER